MKKERTSLCVSPCGTQKCFLWAGFGINSLEGLSDPDIRCASGQQLSWFFRFTFLTFTVLLLYRHSGNIFSFSVNKSDTRLLQCLQRHSVHIFPHSSNLKKEYTTPKYSICTFTKFKLDLLYFYYNDKTLCSLR